MRILRVEGFELLCQPVQLPRREGVKQLLCLLQAVLVRMGLILLAHRSVLLLARAGLLGGFPRVDGGEHRSALLSLPRVPAPCPHAVSRKNCCNSSLNSHCSANRSAASSC